MHKPWLWLPSQLAHDLAPYTLPLVATLFGSKRTPKYKEKEWQGLHFINPIGIAGGVDKKGDSIIQWQRLGAGFLEIGTVTPQPQGPNPGRIMARDTSQFALWNKMGFPGPGADCVKQTLLQKKTQLTVPLFVNIGKNRSTANENASHDYILGLETFHEVADAFVVNISSPNTKGLRDLLSPQSLRSFLQPILEKRRELTPRPILLKLSPDMAQQELESCLQTTLELGIDGWILTNTTLERTDSSPFPIDGGVSGAPLCEKSRHCLTQAMHFLGKNKKDRLLVSVGGIMSADEIQRRLDLGADLVQLYSALVFHGPLFIQNSLKSLKDKQ